MSASGPTRNSRLRNGAATSAPWVVGALLCLVLMNELDRLVGDVIGPSGGTSTLAEVIGPLALTRSAVWEDWAGSAYQGVHGLVLAQVLADLGFIACYAVLLGRIVDRVTFVAAPAVHAAGITLVATVAIVDVLEDVVLAWIALAALGGDAAPFPVVVAQGLLSSLKWLTLLVLACWLLFGGPGSMTRSLLRAAWRGVYAQRLAAIAVAAIAVLSLTTADGVLEQLPDLYRGWISYGGVEVWPAIWTGIAFLATGVVLRWLTRARAFHYLENGEGQEPARLVPWLVAAGVVAVLGAFALSAGFADTVPFLLFLLVLCVIPIASFLIRIGREDSATVAAISPPSHPLLPATLTPDAGHAARAGDAILVLWVALAFLGPFKALVAPTALALGGAFEDSPHFSDAAAPLVVACLVLATAAVAGATLRAGMRDSPAPGVATGRVLLVLSLALLTASLAAPMQLVAWVGPLGMLVLLVGAWASILGSLTIALGRRRTLEVFDVLRLRAAPVVTLLVVLPLVVAGIENAPGLHAIRVATATDTLERVPLDEAYAEWYRADSCAVDAGAGRVKPLLLVAAEGGGIRAATWTVDVLRLLPEGAHDCASEAVFLSSGASGGSVGLATFRGFPDPAEASTAPLGGTEALGSALTGMLSSDIIGAVTGLRPPSLGIPHDPATAWRDRTGLQEEVWEAQLDAFAEPFDTTPVAGAGHLAFTSTDATSLCKVVVSQLDLDASTAGGEAGCDAPDSELPHTIDLVDHLGAGCVAGMSWATATTLSARFPVVSAGGRVSSATLPEGCREVDDMQLVDGGIIDNSALSTLVDIAPALSEAIRQTNARANGADRPFVAPVVMFVSNEPGVDVSAEPDPTRAEALVPLAAMAGATGASVSPAAWLLRAVDDYRAVCPAPPSPRASGCETAVAAIEQRLSHRVVYVSPSTVPAVSVPLGWSLSAFSRSQLRVQAEAQSQCDRDRPVDEDVEDAHAGDPCTADGGYASLGALLELFESAEPAEVAAP